MSEETTVEEIEPDAACYYDRLGLDPRVEDPATAAESAYHDANALKKQGELSAKEFTKVRDARDFLQDDERREQYDTFLERFGREAGTEAYHTWDDQGRPVPPGEWTPSSQSTDAGPRSGRTPDSEATPDPDDGDDGRTRSGDRDADGRTPNERRRRRRQQARQRQRQSRSSETTGRDRQQTTRDSGARTSERRREERSDRQQTTRDSGARTSERRREERSDRQQRRQTGDGQQHGERGDAAGSAAVEAATAATHRVGYLACALGVVVTVGLFVGFSLGVLNTQNEVGPVGLVAVVSLVGLAYVTRRWTDDVEATPDPDTVYDNVLLRPGLVKRAAIAGVGLAVLQGLVEGILPDLALILIGILAISGFTLLPLAYALTQFYDVTLEHVADGGGQ